jgi:hypothetical protein
MKATLNAQAKTDLYSRRRWLHMTAPVASGAELAKVMFEASSSPNPKRPLPPPGNTPRPIAAPAWHMSAFGGIAVLKRKARNSPHGFFRTAPVLQSDVDQCIFNGEKRFKLSPARWWVRAQEQQRHEDSRRNSKADSLYMPVMLPHLVSHNQCLFESMGWLPNGQR